MAFENIICKASTILLSFQSDSKEWSVSYFMVAVPYAIWFELIVA